jgi:hypothetical protein
MVCKAFRALGDECFSCDLEKEYGGHPEWHIQSDCLPLLHGNCSFKTNDGKEHYIDCWDCIIAHPPCTYLTNTQSPAYNIDKWGKEKVEKRLANREKAIEFFMAFTNLGVPTLIENPVGYMNTHYRKPDQNIQPYWFGDSATKRTSLWLFDLPKLVPTKIVEPPPVHHYPHAYAMGGWYYSTTKLPKKEQSRARSKTFPGIAEAIAKQYHDFLTNH